MGVMGRASLRKVMIEDVLEVYFLLSILWTAGVRAECEIVKTYETSTHTYYNLSSAVLAAFDDDVPLMMDLINGGCDINYAGISIMYLVETTGEQYWEKNVTLLHILATYGKVE